MLKAAIFDMDGTLVNSLSFWGIIWEKLGKKYFFVNGYFPPDEVDKAVRTLTLEDCTAYILKKLKINATKEELFNFFNDGLTDFYKTKATLKNGAEELLKFLKSKNVKICLATATNSKTAAEVTKHFGIYGFFDALVSCDDADVKEGKNSPKIYLKALKMLNADIRDTVIFEDSAVALKTAKGLGLKTVGIYDIYNNNADEVKEISDIYISENESLTVALKNLF